MTSFTDLDKKKVCVIGLGITGQSVVRFLNEKVRLLVAMDSAQITIESPVKGVTYVIGEMNVEQILSSDLLVVSPGVPLDLPELEMARQQGIPIRGDISLYDAFNHGANHKTTIAITGSNGKSTVTELVAQMIVADGKKAKAAGNIGYPVLDLLEQEAQIHVLELSSFQLDLEPSFSSDVATVLNISHDHMDRYTSFEDYKASKLSLYQHAQQVVVNIDEPEAYPIRDKSISCTFSMHITESGFGFDSARQMILLNGKDFLDFQHCQLVGQHNVLNLQAAAALAMQVGCTIDSIKQVAKRFTGLAHRCQTVGVFKDVKWVNDSKATNVAAALAAITGIKSQVKGNLYWLAGGVGKGADFLPLQEPINRLVKKTFVFGQDKERIAQVCSNCQIVDSMKEAIVAAKAISNAGDVVLLSPACASLDSFKNYQERGEHFQFYVKELHDVSH
jgi:UDP-N-acetylmuramoylalanine--D-glutamate ligase